VHEIKPDGYRLIFRQDGALTAAAMIGHRAARQVGHAARPLSTTTPPQLWAVNFVQSPLQVSRCPNGKFASQLTGLIGGSGAKPVSLFWLARPMLNPSAALR
jgi:hypothetical protein